MKHIKTRGFSKDFPKAWEIKGELSGKALGGRSVRLKVQEWEFLDEFRVTLREALKLQIERISILDFCYT